MKKILCIFVLVLLFASACSRKKHKSDHKIEDRIEIMPFYQNSVMLKDMHLIDTNLYLVEAQEFLNKEEFKVFTNAVWTMIRNSKAKLLSYPDHVYSEKDLKDRFRSCDTVIESSFDATGNETINKRFNCDTASMIDNTMRIEFYESWYLNTKTNLIEKETLGYTLWSYVAEKEAFRQMFMVFRDEKAAEKAKKYYFY